jgi:hypothetical protein
MVSFLGFHATKPTDFFCFLFQNHITCKETFAFMLGLDLVLMLVDICCRCVAHLVHDLTIVSCKSLAKDHKVVVAKVSKKTDLQ